MPADHLRLGLGADLALRAANRGYVVVCVEQACFGERMERTLKPRSAAGSVDAFNHALLLGQPLLGEQVSDISMVIDWLETGSAPLPVDVDTQRMSIFGHSAGGTTAVYAGAVDPRIQSTIASGCVGYIRETIARRRNDEGQSIIPGILQWLEYDDIVSLHAPRRFIAISGRNDHIWPFDGAQRVVHGAGEVYRAFEAREAVEAVAGAGGHRYYPEETSRAFDLCLRSSENTHGMPPA